jgi:hypothetical protein
MGPAESAQGIAPEARAVWNRNTPESLDIRARRRVACAALGSVERARSARFQAPSSALEGPVKPRRTAMRTRKLGVGALLPALLLLASPAAGSPATLKRSVSNIVNSPFDFVLSPVVATHTLYNNLRDVDDSIGVRVAYTVPGIVWNTGVQAAAAIVRCFTGVLEFVPGLGLVFFEADLDPLFAPPYRGQALIDVDTPPLHIKFGVDYTTVPF